MTEFSVSISQPLKNLIILLSFTFISTDVTICFQLLTAALEANTLPEMYKTVYQKTKQILTDQFGSVIENEDVQQLYTALEDLYDQVWPLGSCERGCDAVLSHGYLMFYPNLDKSTKACG